MRLEKITASTAIALLERAMVIRGDHHVQVKCVNVSVSWDETSETCTYNPECIVGLALWEHGVTCEEFAKNYHTQSSVRPLSIDLASQGVVEIDDDALNIFDLAQSIQDSGMPWGQVLSVARVAIRAFIQ